MTKARKPNPKTCRAAARHGASPAMPPPKTSDGSGKRKIDRRRCDRPAAARRERHSHVSSHASCFVRCGCDKLHRFPGGRHPDVLEDAVDHRRRHGLYTQICHDRAPFALADVEHFERNRLLLRDLLPDLLGTATRRAPLRDQQLNLEGHCVQRMHCSSYLSIQALSASIASGPRRMRAQGGLHVVRAQLHQPGIGVRRDIHEAGVVHDCRIDPLDRTVEGRRNPSHPFARLERAQVAARAPVRARLAECRGHDASGHGLGRIGQADRERAVVIRSRP